MDNQLPKKEEEFIQLWKFFGWVDKARHSHPFFESRFETLKKIFPGFSNSDFTLAHWLTYIYDYMLRTEKIWSEGLLIMGYVAWEFRREGKINEIQKIEEKDGCLSLPRGYVNKLHTGCRYPLHEVRFKHFPTKTNPLVWRTLRILDEMGERDFIKFLTRWKTVGDAAKALYVLTYLKEDENRLIERLKKEDFGGINLLEAPKRLWAALRDYVKDETFLGEKPAGWHEEELELPGDQWNKKFFEGIVKPYFGELLRSVLPKEKEYPPREFLRKFYERRKSDLQGLYPEQFDVTFDLRCRLGDCEFCPLGGEEWKKYCKATQESGEKSICRILEEVFGYTIGCKGKECFLLSNPPPVVCKP